MALGADGAGVLADEIAPLLPFRRQAESGLVGSGFAAGRPQYEDCPAIDFISGCKRVVVRLYGRVSKIQQFSLYRVNRIGIDAHGRQDWTAVLFLDSQYHVTAAQIVEVVGEGADGVQHGLRIPTGFVLDALALDGPLAQQIVEVDGKLARHDVTLASCPWGRLA